MLLVGVALFLVHSLFFEEGEPDDELDEMAEQEAAEAAAAEAGEEAV